VRAREIGFRLLFAVIAGLLLGLFDLWVYQFSWRGFLAGLVAGVVYAVIVVFLYEPGMRRYPLILSALAIIAGSLAGGAWWLVCHGSRWWVALLVGSVLSMAYFASGGLFGGRR